MFNFRSTGIRADSDVEVVDSEMGKVFQFDGVNDYVLGSDVDFLGDVTLAAWIRPELVDNTTRGILGNQVHTPTRRGIVLNHAQYGRIWMAIRNGCWC